MTTRATGRVAIAVILAAVLGSRAAESAEPVGSVVAVEGRAEVQHAGGTTFVVLSAGDDLALGDQIRTLADSKVRLLFRDESVITLAAGSQLSVDEQVAGVEAAASRFSLLVGAVRAIVTERYSKPGARFEMETPTAVAGVRGTGFIASHDAAVDETTVVGLFDTTLVRSKTDPRAVHEVRLGPGEATTVRRGAFPHRPSPMPESVLRGLSGATSLAVGALSPRQRGPGDSGAPKRPGAEAASPEGQVIDQPVDLLRQRGRKGVAPPPPPAPPPAR